MQTQEKSRISNSIINQLQITDTVICDAISENVNKAVLVNYDSIKLLSKTLKDNLKLLGFEIQHSVVLNVIAKALGYQNHHSMKISLEKTPDIINKKSHIMETIEKVDISMPVLPYMEHFINKIDFNKYNSLKDIILVYCDYFYNKKEKYSKQDIVEKLYIDLLNKQEIDFTTKGISFENDYETYMINDTINKCIQVFAQTIYNLTYAYKKAGDNIREYANILKMN